MQSQNRRTPITDAVYPRNRRAQKAKPAGPKREVSPRHGFGIAGQLDSETLAKLGWSPNGPKRKPKRRG